ncbi:MAG: 50S ribosomal protein L19 [Candidatus Bipolaricaulia bacterium]
MDHLIKSIEAEFVRDGVPSFSPGDTIRVYERISEGSKDRVQVFEGVVLKRAHGGTRETFTVRKISGGVGVEKTYPLHSPKIDRIDLVTRGNVRQARPYYLRRRS